jgi:DNA-binding transcriptional ArsR family regulator
MQMTDRDIAKLERKASQAAAMLKSISNKWRLLVLCQLAKGEMSVGAILNVLDLSQSALSQHLAVLRASKLVTTRREAQTIYYSIRGSEASAILTTLYDLYCAPSVPLAAPGKKRAKA